MRYIKTQLIYLIFCSGIVINSLEFVMQNTFYL